MDCSECSLDSNDHVNENVGARKKMIVEGCKRNPITKKSERRKSLAFVDLSLRTINEKKVYLCFVEVFVRILLMKHRSFSLLRAQSTWKNNHLNC